jgi:hypothetical protein
VIRLHTELVSCIREVGGMLGCVIRLEYIKTSRYLYELPIGWVYKERDRESQFGFSLVSKSPYCQSNAAERA